MHDISQLIVCLWFFPVLVHIILPLAVMLLHIAGMLTRTLLTAVSHGTSPEWKKA